MGWFIFGCLLFSVAFLWSFDGDGNEFLIWALCFVGIIAILIHFFRIPTAMELHAGKAVIKYEIVNGVKVDSTFVFREK